MGMIGEYVRLAPAEFDRALSDPAWAHNRVQGLYEALGEPAAGTAGQAATGAGEATAGTDPSRLHDVDKTWHALSFLLDRRNFPVDIVHGELEIPGAEDWGFGPPRALTPEQVRTAAELLAGLPVERLVEGVTAADLAAAGIYPAIVWERGEFDYATGHYEALVPFFEQAARQGDGILLWIS